MFVGPAEAGAALAADRVDLVDEDDAGRVALGLVEQVADAARADADEHLDELGTGDREERHSRLACDRAGKERLTGSRRPDEEDAAWNARPERVELLGVLEELDDLLEVRFCLIDTGHVGEGDDRLVAEEHARPALAEAHCLVVGALSLAHEEDDEQDDDHDRQQSGDQEEDPARVRRLVDLVGDAGGFLVRSHKPALDHRAIARCRTVGLGRVSRPVVLGDRECRVASSDGFDQAGLYVAFELRVRLRPGLSRLDEGVEEGAGDDNEDDHDHPVAQES